MPHISRNHTYLTGIYLGINAIKDAFLLMDGPDCIYKKVELFEKNHDMFSNIFSEEGHHRISSTMVDVNQIIKDRNKQIENMLLQIGNYEKCKVLFLSCMPMAKMVGVDYNMIISKVRENSNAPIINIRHNSLHNDWLDGYGEMLRALAEDMPLKKKKRKNKIGIVGYLYDRNEGDNLGNIEELKRILSEIGLDLCSTWLCGSGYNNLKEIEQAEYIISLPYGRKAANIISKKSGANVIEAEVPIGISNTSHFIKNIAKTTGKSNEAQKFIEKELEYLTPLFSWTVPTYLRNLKISVVADPYMAKALVGALEELDAEIEEIICYSKLRDMGLNNYNIYFEGNAVQKKNAELCVGNSYLNYEYPDTKYIELGFPSFSTHYFYKMPYMGYKGIIHLVNKIINTKLK